ncbi:MAG: glycosyltransferase family 4 protein [Acidimicrobiales bacterium]
MTNDFPPKVGGIQSYLWELWRRLPPEDVTVFTAAHRGAAWWDKRQSFRVVRAPEPVLLPHPGLARRVRELAAQVGAKVVVIDPALPLGLLGPSLALPYALVLHGAEVTVPARLPGSRQLMAHVLSRASLVISAGSYPETEARRVLGAAQELPRSVRVPPGVDTERFRPLSAIERAAARTRFGLPADRPLVLSVSRLVPRKGMDTLIAAASLIVENFPGLHVAIAGSGRDRGRLERLAQRSKARVSLLGSVPGPELPDLYACADVFVLACRSRWGGLEQEGFGIVLVEAAAAGVPCVTVATGGTAEAVADGLTGLVVRDPGGWGARARSARAAGVAEALATVLGDPVMGRKMGEAGRRRVEEELSYDALARKLEAALSNFEDVS